MEYSPEELKAEMDFAPRFACPKCHLHKWKLPTFLHTTPTRLWKAMTVCGNDKCKNPCRWMLDPDKTIEGQTEQMHRPLGF